MLEITKLHILESFYNNLYATITDFYNLTHCLKNHSKKSHFTPNIENGTFLAYLKHYAIYISVIAVSSKNLIRYKYTSVEVVAKSAPFSKVTRSFVSGFKTLTFQG